ncbi:MAG: DUF4845 domain-containing protein, partial [Gammaproteobacteria bacterium]|nr:DUF4845 domain-containing protein [Gammaproteobacteria bacterium]
CASSHIQGSKVFRPAGGRSALRREGGMTTVGLIILVAFVGLFAFAGLRLTPVYLNYMKVLGVINGVQEEFDGANASRAAIRSSISRRFDVESVGEITAREITVTSVDGGFEVRAQYPHVAPFIANVSFYVEFDKAVLVRR